MLPRLYQHLSSIVPYNGNNTSAQDLADQSTRINASNRKLRSQWVHLDGLGSPRSPAEAHRERRSDSDEQTLEDAVEGKEGNDVEKGF